MKRSLLLWMLLLSLFCASFAPGAQAQAVSCNLDYSGINFGADIDILSDQPMTGVGSITASCSVLERGQSARICAGMHPDTYPSRMQNESDPTAFLYYDIFTDPEHTQLWFDPLKIRPYFDVTSTQSTVTKYAYALVRPGQTTSPAGRYSEFFQPPFRYFVYTTGDTPPTCDLPGYNRTLALTFVVATITPNCIISSTPMIFPKQTIITADVLTQSALTVKCTNDPTNPILPYISLDNGLHAASGQRQMENQDKPGNFIKYDLYSDSQRRSSWGSTFGVDTVAIPRSASDKTIAVYGKIPAPQSPAAGPYTDRITATVNF